MRCLPECFGCDKPSPGRGQSAVFTQCHRKGRLRAVGQEKPSTQPALALLPSAGAQYDSGGTPQPPLWRGGPAAISGGLVEPGRPNRLFCGTWHRRGPRLGPKKVGEKPSFSPRASGSVTYRLASYFVLRRNNTLPRPKSLYGVFGRLRRSEDSGSQVEQTLADGR